MQVFLTLISLHLQWTVKEGYALQLDRQNKLKAQVTFGVTLKKYTIKMANMSQDPPPPPPDPTKAKRTNKPIDPAGATARYLMKQTFTKDFLAEHSYEGSERSNSTKYGLTHGQKDLITAIIGNLFYVPHKTSNII
jgi:hypothetical protein